MNPRKSLREFTVLAFTLTFVFSIVHPSFAGGDAWHHAWSSGPSGVAPFAAAPPGPIMGEEGNGYAPNPWHSDAFQPAGTDGCSGPGPCWAQQGQAPGFQQWPLHSVPSGSDAVSSTGYDLNQTNEALQGFLEDARERFTGLSGSGGVSSRIVPTAPSSILGGGGGG